MDLPRAFRGSSHFGDDIPARYRTRRDAPGTRSALRERQGADDSVDGRRLLHRGSLVKSASGSLSRWSTATAMRQKSDPNWRGGHSCPSSCRCGADSRTDSVHGARLSHGTSAVRAGNGEFAVIRRFLERRRARIAAALLPVKRAVLGDEIIVAVSERGLRRRHAAALARVRGGARFLLFEPHEAGLRRLDGSVREAPRAGEIPCSAGGLLRRRRRADPVHAQHTNRKLAVSRQHGEWGSVQIRGDRYIYPVRETVIGTRETGRGIG